MRVRVREINIGLAPTGDVYANRNNFQALSIDVTFRCVTEKENLCVAFCYVGVSAMGEMVSRFATSSGVSRFATPHSCTIRGVF
jgi:hypothetical protein